MSREVARAAYSPYWRTYLPTLREVEVVAVEAVDEQQLSRSEARRQRGGLHLVRG